MVIRFPQPLHVSRKRCGDSTSRPSWASSTPGNRMSSAVSVVSNVSVSSLTSAIRSASRRTESSNALRTSRPLPKCRSRH